MEKKIICLGFYDSGTGKHQSNTVYHSKGKVPAITTLVGGYAADKGFETMEKRNKRVVIGILDPNGFEQDNRVYSRGGCCPAERANNSTILVIRKWRDEENNSFRCDRKYSKTRQR